MPQEPVKSFKVGDEVYDIEESKVKEFLSDMPDAVEVNSFTVDNDTFDIPVEKTAEFLADMPGAKPLSLKKKEETKPAPGYPQNLPGSGGGSLPNSPSQLPLESPSEPAVEGEYSGAQTPQEQTPSDKPKYEYRWGTEPEVADARLGDVQQAATKEAAGKKLVEQYDERKKQEEKDRFDEQVSKIKDELRYSEKFNPFMDDESLNKETEFFAKKGYSNQAIAKAFGEKTDELIEKGFQNNVHKLRADDQIQAINDLKEQGHDETRDGGESDIDKAATDAVNTRISLEATNSFTTDQIKVFNLNTQINELYKKAKENPKSFTKEDAGQIAELRKLSKEIKDNQKLLYDPLTGRLTEATPAAIKFEQQTDKLSQQYQATFKDKLQDLRNEKYYKFKYISSLYDDKAREVLQPMGTGTPQQKQVAQRLKTQYIKAKMELDAANRALLLNEDPSGLQKGALTETTQEIKDKTLENLPIIQGMFPGGATSLNDKDYIENYVKIVGQAAAKDKSGVMEITPAQAERFKGTFYERLGGGIGTTMAILPEMAAYFALAETGSGVLGLANIINKLSKSTSLASRFTAFALRSGINEVVYTGADQDIGSGTGYTAATSLIDRVNWKPKGKLGAALAPFLKNIAGGAAGELAQETGEGAVAALANAMKDDTSIKEEMAKRFGDENGEITISSATQFALMVATIGAMFGASIAATKKGSFTIDPDILDKGADELRSVGYTKEADELNEKANIFRGYTPPPGGTGSAKAAGKVQSVEGEEVGQVNLDAYEFIVDGRRMNKSSFVSKMNNDKSFRESVESGEIPVQINESGVETSPGVKAQIIEGFKPQPQPKTKGEPIVEAEIIESEDKTEAQKIAEEEFADQGFDPAIHHDEISNWSKDPLESARESLKKKGASIKEALQEKLAVTWNAKAQVNSFREFLSVFKPANSIDALRPIVGMKTKYEKVIDQANVKLKKLQDKYEILSRQISDNENTPTSTESKQPGAERTPSQKETVGEPVVPESGETPYNPSVDITVDPSGESVTIEGGKKQKIKKINMDADGNITSVELEGKDGATTISDPEQAAAISAGVELKKLEAGASDPTWYSIEEMSKQVVVLPPPPMEDRSWDEGIKQINGIMHDYENDTNVKAAMEGLQQDYVLADDVEYAIKWAETAVKTIEGIETKNVKEKAEHLDAMYEFLNDLYNEKATIERQGKTPEIKATGEGEVPAGDARKHGKEEAEIKAALGGLYDKFVEVVGKGIDKGLDTPKMMKALAFNKVTANLNDQDKAKIEQYIKNLNQDAIQEQSPDAVDVQKPPTDGQEVGKGDAKPEEPAGQAGSKPPEKEGEQDYPVAGSKPVGQYRPEAKKDIVSEGNKTMINFVNGKRHKAKFVVAKVRDVLPSHNPKNFAKTKGYPVDEKGNTTNDRNYETDMGAQGTVLRYSSKPDPNALLDTSTYTMTGPPMITEDLFVVGGNNRQMVIMNMSDADYRAYYDELKDRAEMFGVEIPEFDNKERVGLYRMDMEAEQYSKTNSNMYNDEPAKPKDEADEAISLSSKLNENKKVFVSIADEIGKHETFSDLFASKASTKYIREFLVNNGILDAKDINKFFDKDGDFSAQGKIKFRKGLFSSVFDEDILRLWDTEGVTSFIKKIETSLPVMLSNIGLGPEFSLKNEIQDAIRLHYDYTRWLRSAKTEGKEDPTIFDFIRNAPLFDKPTPESVYMWLLISTSSAKSNRFKAAITSYNNSASQKPGMFDEGAPKTKQEFLTLIKKYLTDDEQKLIESALALPESPRGPKEGSGQGGGIAGQGENKPPSQGGPGAGIPPDDGAQGGGKKPGEINPDDLFDQLQEPQSNYQLQLFNTDEKTDLNQETKGTDGSDVRYNSKFEADAGNAGTSKVRKQNYPRPYKPRGVEDIEVNMERQIAKKEGVSYMGAAKINGPEDVAVSFRHLESAVSENVFALFQRNDGSYDVLYLHTGETASSVVDAKLIYAAAKEFKAKKVWFVHNHPSGNLTPSHDKNHNTGDIPLHRSVSKAFADSGIEHMPGIIIDLDRGMYSVFKGDDQLNAEMLDFNGKEGTVPYEVHEFNKQVLYVPSKERYKVTGSHSIAEFLSSIKRGTVPKLGVVVMDRHNQITRYSFLDPAISQDNAIDAIMYLASKSGDGIILVSNQKVSPALVATLAEKVRSNGLIIVDVVEVDQDAGIRRSYTSWAEEGKDFREPDPNYSANRPIADKIVKAFIENETLSFPEIIDRAYNRIGEEKLRSTFPAIKDAYEDYYINADDAVSQRMDDIDALNSFDLDKYIDSKKSTLPDLKEIEKSSPPAVAPEPPIEEAPGDEIVLNPLRQAYKDFADWYEREYPDDKFYYDVAVDQNGPHITVGGKPIIYYNDWIKDQSKQKDWKEKRKEVDVRPPLVVVDKDEMPTPTDHVKSGKYAIDEDQRLAVNLILDRFAKATKKEIKSYPSGYGIVTTSQSSLLAEWLAKLPAFSIRSWDANNNSNDFTGVGWGTVWHNLKNYIANFDVDKTPLEFYDWASNKGEFGGNIVGAEKNGNAFLLGDGTGVGKTRTELVSALEMANKTGKPSLIITQNVQIIDGFKSEMDALGFTAEDRDRIEIGTYDGLKTKKVGTKDYGVVVFDEAHKLKHLDSGRSEAATAIKADNFVYATATPMDTPTSAAYFMAKVLGLEEDVVADMLGYRIERAVKKDGEVTRRAVLKKGSTWGRATTATRNLRAKVIKEGGMIRREFPFFGQIHSLNIPFTKDQATMYKDLVQQMKERKTPGRVASMGLSRWTQFQKFNYTMSEAMRALADGKQVIIFTDNVNPHLIKSLNYVVPGFLEQAGDFFKKRGIEVARIFGDGNKSDAIRSFQSGKVKVALATPQSGGTGVNLDDVVGDSPREVFVVTPPYSGMEMDQVLGRTSRRNTKSPTILRLVYMLGSSQDVSRKNINERKLAILRNIQAGMDPDDAGMIEWRDDDIDDVGGIDNEESMTDAEYAAVAHPHESMQSINTGTTPNVEPFIVSVEVKRLLEELGVPVAENYLSKKQLGVYKHMSKNIRVRALFNTFVAAHEGAHFIDFENSISDNILANNDPIITSLTKIYVDNYPGAKDTHPKRKRVVEGIAVFIERYFADPAHTARHYPDLVADLINPAGQYYSPKFTQLLDGMSDIAKRYNSLTPMQRIGARVRRGDEVIESNTGGPGYGKRQRIIEELINANEPLRFLDKLAGTEWWSRDKTNANQSIEGRYINYNNRAGFVNSLVNGVGLVPDKNGNFEPTNVSMMGYMKHLKKKGDAAEFSNYLIARRTVSDYNEMCRHKAEVVRLEAVVNALLAAPNVNQIMVDATNAKINYHQGKADAIESILNRNNINVQESIQLVDDNKARFEKAEAGYDAVNKALLVWMLNTGKITMKKYVEWEDREGYARFLRYIDDDYIEQAIDAMGGRSDKKLMMTLKYEGSEKDIIDPIYGQALAIREVVKKGLENMVWVQIAKLASQDHLVARRFELMPYIALKDSKGNISFKNASNKNQKAVYINGKVSFWKMAPELRRWNEYLGLQGAPNDVFTMLFVNLPTRVFQISTTGTYLPFAAANLSLDALNGMINSKVGFKPIFDHITSGKDLAQSFMNFVNGNELIRAAVKKITGKDLPQLTISDISLFQKYLAMGGDKMTKYNIYSTSPQDLVDQMIGGEVWYRKLKQKVDDAFDIALAPVNFTEWLTRYLEFKRAVEAGYSDTIAMQMAATVSAPFYRRGRFGGAGAMRWWINAAPYLNPAVQGTAQYFESSTQRPERWVGANAILMTAGLSAAFATYLYATEEDKQFITNVPIEELGKYLWIPKGIWGGKGFFPIRIPDVLSQWVGLSYMYVAEYYKYNKVDAGRAADMMLSGLPQQLQLNKPAQALASWIPQAVGPAVKTAFNIRTYPELAPIVSPYYDMRYLPEDQYSKYSSDIAKKVGAQIGLSPMKIDNYIAAQFGRTWSFLTGGRNVNNPFSRQAVDFQMRGQQINDFYRAYEHSKQSIGSLDRSLAYLPEGEKKKVIKEGLLYEHMNDALSLLRKVHDEGAELPFETTDKLFRTLQALDETEDFEKQVTKVSDLWENAKELADEYKIKHAYSIVNKDVIDAQATVKIIKRNLP